jgi:hypothetical protein
VKLTDAYLLDALRSNYWKLEPFEMPTGQGDADVGWRVTDYHESVPRERTVAEVFHDDPRAALAAAVDAVENPSRKMEKEDIGYRCACRHHNFCRYCY